MYSKMILNAFLNPKNTGRIMKPDGIASNFDSDNTQNVEFSIRVVDDVILDCQFRAQANPYVVAVCSMMTNMIKGQKVDELKLDVNEIYDKLGSDCDISFCLDCVNLMIEDYIDKQKKENKVAKTNNDDIPLEIKPEIITGEIVNENNETNEVVEEDKTDLDVDNTKEENENLDEKQKVNNEVTDDLTDDDFGIDFSDFFDDDVIE